VCLAGELRIVDRYFDTEDFVLTTQDHWLRLRDSRWELKQPIGLPDSSPGSKAIDTYREITSEGEIAAALCVETQR
jgi:hypothetical protein